MFIVTAGKAFNDIDAFACAVAYAELLRLEGKDAQAVFVGPLNHTVTSLALEQDAPYALEYVPKDEDQMIYVDLSDPAHFAFSDLDESRVVEIFDHHYGWEEHWKTRLGERSHIERVGAAATLIWEEFKKRDQKISAASAKLLSIAILQNTLNFTSTETNERDTQAFEELKAFINLPAGWQERYFSECAQGMRAQFRETLRSDTKIFERYFDEQTFVFSQLEITEDPVVFLEKYRQEIDGYWSEYPGARAIINIADISSKTSLLYSNDVTWLRDVLAPMYQCSTTLIHYEDGSGTITIPIHQRKQILKALQK